MNREEIARQLRKIFLSEIADYVESLNRDLLEWESCEDASQRAQIVERVFRGVHSVKGAARSAEQPVIERAFHLLEEMLSSARSGELRLGDAHFQLLYSGVDALDDARARLTRDASLDGAPIDALAARLATWRQLDGATAPDRPPEEDERRRDAPAPDPIEAAAAEQARAEPSRPAPSSHAAEESTVRVESAKLEAILSRAGELIASPQRMVPKRQTLDEIRQVVSQIRRDLIEVSKAVNVLSSETARPVAVSSGHHADTRRGMTQDSIALLQMAPGRLREVEERLDDVGIGLQRELQDLDRQTRRLGDDVRRLRMFPFRQIQTGLARGARDVAREGQKELDIHFDGGEVQLDRAILERLQSPLLHLIRNAVDHGIEPPKQRSSQGKPAAGRLEVAVELRGAQVEIRVSDDGRGLDIEAIRERARRNGLEAADSPEDVQQLIFEPGFSTAETVTEVSGRGVGLDVVRSQVEAVHGTIDIESVPGQGTSVALVVPLTLSAIQALVVRCQGYAYAISSTNVERLLQVPRQRIEEIGGRDMLEVDGNYLPVVDLEAVLGLAGSHGEERERLQIVVVRAAERSAAVRVDGLEEVRDVVVQRLDARRGSALVAGACALEGAEVALILHAAEVVRRSKSLRARVGRDEAGAPAPRRQARLLIADDSVTTRTLERSILEAAGYDVTVAVDGLEAWELLQEKAVDLVVTDVEMPRLDGFELTRRIRRSPQFEDLPVILLTTLENDEHKRRGLEVGADAYLVKRTFDQRELIETIEQLS